MGRYYNGDIEGKFWFAVQSSDDASFFGGTEYEPNSIEYIFEEHDLEDIKTGIEKCLDELGENKKKLDDFFKENNSYNEKMLEEKAKIKPNEIRNTLEWYARLELGEKILKSVEENGQCCFEAEL
jgi:hypothetical protein